MLAKKPNQTKPQQQNPQANKTTQTNKRKERRKRSPSNIVLKDFKKRHLINDK